MRAKFTIWKVHDSYIDFHWEKGVPFEEDALLCEQHGIIANGDMNQTHLSPSSHPFYLADCFELQMSVSIVWVCTRLMNK